MGTAGSDGTAAFLHDASPRPLQICSAMEPCNKLWKVFPKSARSALALRAASRLAYLHNN
eukprot:12881224-Prorocentrum_lima.AAC.1